MDMKDFRSCYVTYKAGLFLAYSFDYDKRYYTPREVDNELEGLLVKCKEAGFNHLDGLTEEAIHAAGNIDAAEGGSSFLSAEEMAVLQYVEDLWQSGIYSVRCVVNRNESPPEEWDFKASRQELARYGIKPTPYSGGVYPIETVNKLIDELGV